jgi:hypothetical protein
MAADEDEVEEPSDLPLDESLYVSEEDDTLEKVKRGFKQFGRGLKRGGEEIAAGSKKLASKSKEKLDSALEKRKQAKVMKDPLAFPWKSLSVADLKDRLRQLGLTVSGKKDDLVDRIMQHYRTEIPTTEDGATELMGDLDQIPDVPPAPDLVEMSQADDEVEQNQEVVQESQPDFREIPPETPIFQDEQDGQLYAYDPPRVIDQKTGKRTNRLRRSINNLFAFMLFIFTLSVIDVGFDMWIFDKFGILNEILANRVIRTYGGMSDTMTVALSASVAIIFFAATLMLLSGRRPATAGMLVMTAVSLSFVIRGGAAIVAGSFDDITVVVNLIFDLMLAIPFTVTFWIPAMLQLLLPSDETEPTSGFYSEPESITDTSDDTEDGEDMGRFDVDRPDPPKRRQRGQGSPYELLFLILALISWPVTLLFSTLVVGEVHVSNFGIDKIWSANQQGLMLLLPLYIFSFVCTYACYRLDQEAREGDVYAKQKAAYHRDMDQYLDLKKAYYEKAADDLGMSSSTGEES